MPCFHDFEIMDTTGGRTQLCRFCGMTADAYQSPTIVSWRDMYEAMAALALEDAKTLHRYETALRRISESAVWTTAHDIARDALLGLETK
jgi:hypothetical protein